MNIKTTKTITIHGEVGYLQITTDGNDDVRIEAGYSDYRESSVGFMEMERKDIQQVIDALQSLLKDGK